MRGIDKRGLKIIKETLLTIAIYAICTGICFLLDYFKVPDLNFLIIYVLGILIIAVFTSGFIYSSVVAVVSVFGYNFFFTIPRFTFKINDSMYLVTFVLMLLVGLGISLITYKLKNKMHEVARLNADKIYLKNESDKELIKATLLRSISHDLRTPLTTIKNGAEVLLSCGNISTQDKNELLESIVDKSEWTIRLVENLLSMTKIDSSNMTVKKSLEAVEEILPGAVRSASGFLGNRKIYYDIPDELLLVPMDATLIMQTVGNILSNAVRYTQDNGSIWMQVFCTGSRAVFRISNDGEPIKDEDIAHVFDMYYTTLDSKNENGVGLGLSICKLIISAHGGEISARNTDDKVVFEFTLPMEDANGTSINN